MKHPMLIISSDDSTLLHHMSHPFEDVTCLIIF